MLVSKARHRQSHQTYTSSADERQRLEPCVPQYRPLSSMLEEQMNLAEIGQKAGLVVLECGLWIRLYARFLQRRLGDRKDMAAPAETFEPSALDQSISSPPCVGNRHQVETPASQMSIVRQWRTLVKQSLRSQSFGGADPPICPLQT